jgi:hypothetical protein
MRTVTIVVLSICILTLAACAVATDADRVNRAAATIADFDLPAGYSAEFTASVKGYTVVSYRPDDATTDSPSHLYLAQSEDETDGDTLEATLRDLAPGASDPASRTVVVEIRTVTIRDQATTLVISDNTNGEGARYRQATALFEGKGGPAILVYSDPIDRWDETTLDALLKSIH